MKSLWILSLINYQEPTYHNGTYNYPNWAYALGWIIASLSLICIPAYAIVNVIRASGDTFCDKLHNAVKPNIYECKICGEHHCEHDFPEDQYMLPPCQEMTPIIQPKIILKAPPLGNNSTLYHTGAGQRYQQQQQSPQYEQNQEQQQQLLPPHTTVSLVTSTADTTTTTYLPNNSTIMSINRQDTTNNEDPSTTTTATTTSPQSPQPTPFSSKS